METEELEAFFSSQWDGIVAKCERMLDPGDLDQIRALASWGLVQQEVLGDKCCPPRIGLIRPALGHLNAFTTFFESKLGPKLESSLVWGATGILLQFSTEDLDPMGKIPRMLKSFAHKAETFNGYCDRMPWTTNPVKEACFDIQLTLVEFLTGAVKYIRDDLEICHPRAAGWPSRRLESSSWSPLERRFATASQEILETLPRVEKLVQIGLPLPRPTLSSLSLSSPTTAAFGSGTPAARRSSSSCLMMPHTKTSRFFDRVDVFEQLDLLLEGGSTPPGALRVGAAFRSVAMYGLGGVGKSSIASAYAEKRFDEGAYDTVLWVQGEKTASMAQSFTAIAMKLKLPGAQPQAHDENLLLVQDWFQYTDSRWIIVYDNVESEDILRPFWPSSSQGRAIVTTRNHSLAFAPASAGLEVPSWDAPMGSEFLMFLLANSGPVSDDERTSALVLAERLSGHALAITHMAGLIHRRAWSIQEFMGIYLKNPRRVHNHPNPRHQHQDSELATLWDFSLRSLGADSLALLGTMAFLAPDGIPSDLFDTEPAGGYPEALQFCGDEFSFSDAVEGLLALALLSRNRNTRVFCVHRVVQTQLKLHLSLEARQKCFDDAVALVYDAFPKESEISGQLYGMWDMCGRYLQHVISLRDCFREEKAFSKSFRASRQFCQLLAHCQRQGTLVVLSYLSETHLSHDLQVLIEVNLLAIATLPFGPDKTDLTAATLTHKANMVESSGDAAAAIALNTEAYNLRLGEAPPKTTLLAFIENNLALNYMGASDHAQALKFLEKSRDRWIRMREEAGEEARVLSFMKTNMARCLIYLGNYKEGGPLLDAAIGELEGHKEAWASLCHAYFVRGLLERREGRYEAAEASFMESQNGWTLGDRTRLHPFNGACMYKMGACCLDQGKVEATIKHIRDAMEVSKFHAERLPAEHARNLFKLSEALTQNSDKVDHEEAEEQREAAALRDEAEVYLRKAHPLAPSFDTEASYDRYIPIYYR